MYFRLLKRWPPVKDMSTVVTELTQKALGDLEKMRKKEGSVLQKDLISTYSNH